MFYIPIILICGKGVVACHADNALDTIPLPPENTPMGCLMQGQTKLASLAIAPKEGETFTIVCKIKR
jgi:hypothetical protein